MVSNSVLRANARKQLGSSIFSHSWIMILVCCLIVSVISGVAYALSVFVLGALYYGMARVTVRRACNDGEVDIGDIFKGFSEKFLDSMFLYIVQCILIFLWSCLFFIPGIVKLCSYSMSFYIMQDDPSKSWKKCIDESRDMMNGHKMQYFLLQLSFIGWLILGTLLCGIGLLFVIPYICMANANFYLALKASRGNYGNNAGVGNNGTYNGTNNGAYNGSNNGAYNGTNVNGGNYGGNGGAYDSNGNTPSQEPYSDGEVSDKNGSDDSGNNNNLF